MPSPSHGVGLLIYLSLTSERRRDTGRRWEGEIEKRKGKEEEKKKKKKREKRPKSEAAT